MNLDAPGGIDRWEARLHEDIEDDMKNESLCDVAHVIVRFSADLVRFTVNETGIEGMGAAATVLGALQSVLHCVVHLEEGKSLEEIYALMDIVSETATELAREECAHGAVKPNSIFFEEN